MALNIAEIENIQIEVEEVVLGFDDVLYSSDIENEIVLEAVPLPSSVSIPIPVTQTATMAKPVPVATVTTPMPMKRKLENIFPTNLDKNKRNDTKKRAVPKRRKMAHPKINTFVFLDLETTGLPHMERTRKTRIVELCMMAISRSEYEKSMGNGELPRIVSKLSFAINPNRKMSEGAASMTKLSDKMLKNEMPFDENRAQMMKCFINQFKGPICLIAHNGFLFDFPLLRSELLKYGDVFPNDIKCADSITAFRDLCRRNVFTDEGDGAFSPFLTKADLDCFEAVDAIENTCAINQVNEGDSTSTSTNSNGLTPEKKRVSTNLPNSGGQGVTSPSHRRIKSRLGQGQRSFKLVDLFEDMFGTETPMAHSAEGDVVCLAMCCMKSGQPMLDWIESNNRPFVDITPRYTDL